MQPNPEREAVATPVRASTQPPVSLRDAAGALQVLRHGGADDSTLEFDLPPSAKATISPSIAALRWTAVLFGILFGAGRSAEGDLAIVVTTTLMLFFTTWRSMLPLKLAGTRNIDRIRPLIDGAVVGAALGFSDGLASPFAFGLLAAATVAAFGWGTGTGILTFLAGCLTAAIVDLFVAADAQWTSQVALGVVLGTIAAVVLAGFTRSRLLESERRRHALTGTVDTLAEANDLLAILNRVARTIPTALDLRDALESTKTQIRSAMPSDVLCILSTESGEFFEPQITDNMSFPPRLARGELPDVLQDALDSSSVIRLTHEDGSGLSPTSRSGLYAPLRTRDRLVGVIAVEANATDAHTDSSARLLGGLTDVIALSIDNARWFGRLRTLGAEEERTRIARDLHDRIGQWLTYIGFELERIADSDQDTEEIRRLHVDVQTAIDELRETLRSLRTNVTADRPFANVAKELIDRLAARRVTEVKFVQSGIDESLPIPVENELLRIMQEALNNVDKHASASEIEVRWDVQPDVATLTIRDDGRGFDVDKSVRDTAYGLVGMTERADAVGAHLTIDSEPGMGSTVEVQVIRTLADGQPKEALR